MIKIIERVDHKYDNQEEGETFTLVWRHISIVVPIPSREEIIKELFLPPDAKVHSFPQEAQDGSNHFVVSGWWGRE